MAGEYDDTVLRDLRAHLQTAKIPLDNLSTLAQKGDDQLVKQFLSENIQIEASGPDARQSQLYIACFWGIRDIVQQLLEIGTNTNKQNKGSLWTPLHAATFQEHGPVIMLLLDKDAQPELPDSEGRTPKDFASASDKIWPLFAAMQLERTSRAELIDKHIIRKGSPHAPFQPGRGIKMADYAGPSGQGESDRYMQAAMMGDVLADDPDHAAQGSRAGEQPQMSLWK